MAQTLCPTLFIIYHFTVYTGFTLTRASGVDRRDRQRGFLEDVEQDADGI